jgi:hypothetical protein
MVITEPAAKLAVESMRNSLEFIQGCLELKRLDKKRRKMAKKQVDRALEISRMLFAALNKSPEGRLPPGTT